MNSDRIAEVYKGEFGSEEQHERARRRIHWMISQVRGPRVLDIGCSQGIASILLGRKGFEVIGIDVQDSRIEYALADLAAEDKETQARVSFQLADGEALEFDDGSFDSVLLGEVIEHLVDPERILAEARRVLRPDGVLVLTTPFGFLHHHDHRQTFYVDDVFALVSRHMGVVSAEIADRYFRIVAVKGSDSDPAALESLRTQANMVVMGIQQDLDATRRQVNRVKADLELETKRATLAEKRADGAIASLDRVKDAWRASKAELQTTKQHVRSLSVELKDQTRRMNQLTQVADDLTKARRQLRKRERELLRLRYRLEVSNWKLASLRQRRWWRIGAELGKVKRQPLSLFSLPLRVLSVIRAAAPPLPRPTPPSGLGGRGPQSGVSPHPEASGDAQRPIRPRYDLAALAFTSPELSRMLTHEFVLFELDKDGWKDQLKTLSPHLLIVESGTLSPVTAQFSDVLIAAHEAEIQTVLWDTNKSALPDDLREHFDVVVDGDATSASDASLGLIQPRIHNPIGATRRKGTAEVDLHGLLLANESHHSSGDLAIAAKEYRVLRSSVPTSASEIAAVAATATPVLVPDAQEALGIPVDSVEMADEMERSLLRSEVLRARFTHPQMRLVLRSRSISSEVAAFLPGSLPRWPLIDIMVATKRPQKLESLFANLGRQTYPNFRVSLVAHGVDLDEAAVKDHAETSGVRLETVMTVPEDVILGEVFNIGFAQTEAPIVAKMDDDDFYGAEYLWDLYSALDFSGAEVAGKWAHYAYLEGLDSLIYRYPKYEHRFTDVVAISTLLMRREVLEAERFPAMPWGSGSVFLRALGSQGARVFAADRWNYLYVRGRDGDRNTFPMSDLKLLSISDVVCRGMNVDEVVV